MKYKSLIEALTHAGIQTPPKIDIQYIDAEILERDGVGVLKAQTPHLRPADLVDLRVKFCIRRQHKIHGHLLRHARGG